ncbi:MAG: hypothetical protein HY929_04655, partial [Euryarchaeota archaeon]|nr:hypothetical protein [Euryarchaeota archaeon]
TIKNEMDASTTTATGANNPHNSSSNIASATCKRCHGSLSFAVNKTASSTDTQVDYYITTHKSPPSPSNININRSQSWCPNCHGNPKKVTTVSTYTNILSGNAHSPLVSGANNETRSLGCFVCHVGINTTITVKKQLKVLNVTAWINTTASPEGWNVTKQAGVARNTTGYIVLVGKVKQS